MEKPDLSILGQLDRLPARVCQLYLYHVSGTNILD